jgi:hypothetical protein
VPFILKMATFNNFNPCNWNLLKLKFLTLTFEIQIGVLPHFSLVSRPIHMICALCSQCPGLGVVWPPKTHRNAGLFSLTFFTFCYFFLLLVTFVNYFFTVEGSLFVTFFTTCNCHKLLFTIERGNGNCCIIFIHCSGGGGAFWFFLGLV